jgi:hypothetical protein
MNGHHLKIGMPVRVVLDLRTRALGQHLGEVVEIGPRVLGSMPSWALVRFRSDDDFTYRYGIEYLEPAENKSEGQER